MTLQEEIEYLRSPLVSIRDYWREDYNPVAMEDALLHASSEACIALERTKRHATEYQDWFFCYTAISELGDISLGNCFYSLAAPPSAAVIQEIRDRLRKQPGILSIMITGFFPLTGPSEAPKL